MNNNKLCIYPKISVVTPNYNKGDFLENTILSVLSQNYPNLEYIIIDGGSTDDSISIIRKYESQLTYWVSEPDKGMYDAIKKGFSHATGEIMAWIGSDDMYHPNCFNIVAEIFQNDKINWLVGASSLFDKLGRTVHVAPSRYFSRLDLLSGDFRWIQQESSFWRKKLYDKVKGLNTNFRYAGDFDLWLRFSSFECMYVSSALLGGFRISNEGKLSLALDKYTEEVMESILQNSTDLDEKRLRTYNRRKTLVKIVSKFKIFNTDALNRFLFKKEQMIASNQIVSFERSFQKFVLK